MAVIGVEQTEITEIWNRYYRRLYVYLKASFKLTDPDIEDNLQEIFLKVHQGLEDFDPRRSMSVWIYSIARNHMIDVLRKNRRMIRAVHMVESNIESPYTGPDGYLIAGELEAIISKFMTQLDPVDAEVAYLRHFESMKYREISKATGIAVGTIKWKISRIRKRLSRCLSEQGYPTYEK